MLAPLHHILPLTTIVRERLLPIPGTVIAKVNQKVSPTEVVAQATWAREHVLIDVANPLHISAAAADRLIRCKVGDVIQAGAEIAHGGGMMPQTIRSPKQGRVVAIGGGEVLLETGETNIQLRAGMPGTVVQVIPDRGVIIQNHGSLIQGVWGNGRIETGMLVNVTEKANSELVASIMEVSLRGSILLGGICRDREALEAAGELPVRGLVLSSLDPLLIPYASQARFPIILTEGFGALPMNSVAYRLLSTNVKREVTLNAEVYDRYSGARPEVFIPLPVTQEPPLPRDMEAFAEGQTVRMRRPPSMGGIGTIISLGPGQVTLASGLRAQAAQVQMEGGETIIVPLVNLEVVG
jgi:hypothetical protein